MEYEKEQNSNCSIPDDLDNNVELDVEKSWLSILR